MPAVFLAPRCEIPSRAYRSPFLPTPKRFSCRRLPPRGCAHRVSQLVMHNRSLTKVKVGLARRGGTTLKKIAEGPNGRPAASGNALRTRRSTLLSFRTVVSCSSIDEPNRSREPHRAIARGNPQARQAVLSERRAYHQRPRVRPALQGTC